MDLYLNRQKRLDLLGGLGAGALGAGIALLFAQWLEPFAIPALLIGVLAHGWAMLAKRKMECQIRTERLKRAVAAERLCWVMLAGFVAYVVYGLLGSH